MSTPPGPMQSHVNDPYVVLGVLRSASRREIAEAYRRLAKRHHPDVASDPAAAAERMRWINAAWHALSKPRADAGHRASTAASAHWSSADPTARRAARGPSRSWAPGRDQSGAERFSGRGPCRAPIRRRSRSPRPVRSEVRFQDTGLAALLVAGVMVLLLFAAAYAGTVSSSSLTS